MLAAQVGMNAFDGARAVCQRLMRAGLALSPAERAFHNAVLVSVLRPLADIQPDDIRTRALLAIVLLDDARAVSEAQGLLDAAYRSGAEDAYLSLAYGILFFKIGDMARAAGYLAPGGAGDPCAEDRAYWARLAEAGAGDDWRAPEALAAFAAHELYHLGEALARGRRPAAAADALSEVVARAPHWIDVYPTLATLLGMLGRSVEALDHCRRADALFPNDPGILWEISHCHLALGDLAAGWRQAENRLKVWQSHSEARHRGVPKWSGEDLTGKTVVVWREEGIGDEIRLSSCLPEFRNRTGATVVWECSPRLAGLYARSLDGIAVVAEAPDNGVYDAADFHLPVGDLPLHYRESLEAFPETGRFLEADPDLAAVWRTRLDGLGAGPKIGVGWRSLNNSWIKAPMSSSATDWRAVFAIPGAQFVNLQCDADAGEIERIRERFGAPFHAFGDLDLKDDLEGVAALIDGLDLVISCRCWLIHLAGALGREVLTFSAPPNALMMGLAYNPWAPETEVFYGAVDEPWEPVLNEMASRACGLLDL
ncbi:MAG: hypothetical protein OXR84_11415 [Magnetovibrio sp.]|nr:hypothetical protein [Magnetovibrio sp.]